jgi:hypothetical protein
MAIRWSQIQNLTTTEFEVNKLSGLLAIASDLNKLSGFNGTTADLNSILGLAVSSQTHFNTAAHLAHSFESNSIDGQSLVNGTLPLSKLAFDIVTVEEFSDLSSSHAALQSDHDSLATQVAVLTGIVIPGQGADIVDSIAQAVAHIENINDAHDATAISYGMFESGYYYATANLNSGEDVVQLTQDSIKFFKVGDSVQLHSNIANYFSTSITAVNYDTFQITIAQAPAVPYLVAHQFRVINDSQNNVQQALDRSLRNTTDKLSGRLTIENSTSMNTLVIDSSQSVYDIEFTNKASLYSGDGYSFEIGQSSSDFEVINAQEVKIFGLDSSGNAYSNTYSLKDYSTNYVGLITKESLTADRTWTIPDRDGYVAIGDMTFWDLLRVTADKPTGKLFVAPGVMEDLYGQKVRAWINIAEGSDFPGEEVDLALQLDINGKLDLIEDKYIAFIVYLTYDDELFFYYSEPDAVTGFFDTEEEAITAIPAYLPTAYMKLAIVTVKGDGSGGIDNNTIKIHEDMRPIVSQGMSNAHYDESRIYTSGLASSTPVALPNNSRAGGRTQGYHGGKGELEIYVNGTFRERGRDYIEINGTAPGQIAFLYALPEFSVVRFRISWGAATSVTGGNGGGGGASTLQDAYLNGPNIFTFGTPVSISAASGSALDLVGDLNIQGFISSSTGIEFINSSSEPGPSVSTNNKLYSNNSGDLLYKNNSNSTTYNITASLENNSQQQGRSYLNNTGSLIPAFTAVSLDAVTAGQIVKADVSSDIAKARIFGITTQDIASGASGKVVWNGYVPGAGQGLTHNSIIVASPSADGEIVEEQNANLVEGNMVVEIGIVDGTGLLVNIIRKGQL